MVIWGVSVNSEELVGGEWTPTTDVLLVRTRMRSSCVRLLMLRAVVFSLFREVADLSGIPVKVPVSLAREHVIIASVDVPVSGGTYIHREIV